MADDTYDMLRRAVVQALGPRPSPDRRRQVAVDLRALADQQERLAATAERDRPARAEGQTSRREEPSQPRRTPGAFVRIGHEPDPQTGARRIRLSLGRQCWSDLGSPERIDLQRVGADIWVVPVTGRAGHRLSLGGGLPSCLIDDDAPAARLAPGRYAATLQAGAIVVGERVG